MFRRFFPRHPSAQELDEEMQSHFDMEMQLLQGRFLTREEAQAYARKSFGNRTLTAEQTRAVGVGHGLTTFPRTYTLLLERFCTTLHTQ
jgi:hypothetical protein